MTYNIIACGETGKYWNGNGHNVGVNDAAKWGHRIEHLLLANAPGKFEPERLKIIMESRPENFYSNTEAWRKYFPNMIHYKTESWNGTLIKKRGLTTMNSSPCIAMHLAWQLGATKLILWGVDFNNHQNINGGNLKTELRQYRGFIHALLEHGVETYLGASGSALEEFVNVIS